jgi:hypothetical protein
MSANLARVVNDEDRARQSGSERCRRLMRQTFERGLQFCLKRQAVDKLRRRARSAASLALSAAPTLLPDAQTGFTTRCDVSKVGAVDSQELMMREPLVEHRELAPRLEVQVRVVSGEPGAPMRFTRYFSLTERGLGELAAHAAGLEAGAAGKSARGGFK